MQPGHSYRVINPQNQYHKEKIMLSRVVSGIGWAFVDGHYYPFMPAELEAIEPTPPKPRRPSPAKRAAIYKELLQQIVKEWNRMPQHLRDDVTRALEL